jgi:2-C-methyl-D-erythritol 4-phosphate cytidylyltransferase
MIEGSIQRARQVKAVVVAVPVKETIKLVGTDQAVVRTLDRASLWQIQTPQTFQLDVFREALRKATEDGFIGTDDASLVERIGVKVYILQGSYSNIKITTPEDLVFAYNLMDAEKSVRREAP